MYTVPIPIYLILTNYPILFPINLCPVSLPSVSGSAVRIYWNHEERAIITTCGQTADIYDRQTSGVVELL